MLKNNPFRMYAEAFKAETKAFQDKNIQKGRNQIMRFIAFGMLINAIFVLS
jgi:hypothetical protein